MVIGRTVGDVGKVTSAFDRSRPLLEILLLIVLVADVGDYSPDILRFETSIRQVSDEFGQSLYPYDEAVVRHSATD